MKKAFLTLTLRRLAATALAALCYRADHGTLPETLDVLVPDYLPAVPLDPFDPANRPLRYRPGDDARVYSVGVDGQDGGGSQDSDYQLRGEWNLPDVCFRLTARAPTAEACNSLASLLSQLKTYQQQIQQQSNQAGQQQPGSQPSGE